MGSFSDSYLVCSIFSQYWLQLSREKFNEVQDDIRKVELKEIANIAIVNGVLEWVPEFGDVELKKFFGKN